MPGRLLDPLAYFSRIDGMLGWHNMLLKLEIELMRLDALQSNESDPITGSERGGITVANSDPYLWGPRHADQ